MNGNRYVPIEGRTALPHVQTSEKRMGRSMAEMRYIIIETVYQLILLVTVFLSTSSLAR